MMEEMNDDVMLIMMYTYAYIHKYPIYQHLIL